MARGIKVWVDGRLFDAEKEPIFLIFDSDESRKVVASHLQKMEEKPGIRVYEQHPYGSMDKAKFDSICDKVKESLANDGLVI